MLAPLTILVAGLWSASLADCAKVADDSVRLACYDELATAEEPANAERAPDVAELMAQAVDRHLAATLFDPTSPIQYQTSRRFDCVDLYSGPPIGNGECVCYAVNAKNRYGAYVGQKLYAAPVRWQDDAYSIAEPIPATTSEVIRRCQSAGMQDRPPSRITDQLSR